jgi:hypothetical protein
MQHREESGRIILKYILKIIVIMFTGFIWFGILANIGSSDSHICIKISE